ncbi:hypothetical protein GQ457_14G001530 [Hibiscus cannabinus]
MNFDICLHPNLQTLSAQSYSTSQFTWLNQCCLLLFIPSALQVETLFSLPMAHLLTPVPATAISPVAISNKLLSPTPLTFHPPHHALDDGLVHRRAVTLGLAGALLGFNVGDQRQANAARRPPPPPPLEKKDPSVSGVQAKVLASKKRKEAMKQAVAKMRENGKSVEGSPPPSE